MARLGNTVLLLGAALAPALAMADVNLPSKFSNQGGIVNTRHNLTQSTIGAGAVIMNPYRNDYEEVCVYCHTPHGAATGLQAPLWNRTQTSASYNTYDQLGTGSLIGTVTTPGPNSLTCLSCHDGTIAVDSIINMPGSGRYDASQEFSQNNSFLDSWTNSSGADASVHMGLAEGECLVCHSADAGPVGAGASDFDVFALGTDLRDDHPIGVEFPSAPGLDFNPFTAMLSGQLAFYDGDADGRPDKDEIRLYETGDGYEVECASCHDPHGVPSAGPGSLHQPSFLRIANTASAVCQTCHNK